MYQLLSSLTLRQSLTEQLPALTASFLIAEWCYKFHSFSLECLAFLITWLALDALIMSLKRTFTSSKGSQT